MDTHAGKCLSGWNRHTTTGDLHGRLSPKLIDVISTITNSSDAEEQKQKLSKVCKTLFIRSHLPTAFHHLIFGSILRYWTTFVTICEGKVVNKPDHMVISLVKHACISNNVSYEDEFLTWAKNCESSFILKNVLGIPGESLRSIPKDFIVDGRNFLESHCQMRDVLNTHTQKQEQQSQLLNDQNSEI